MALLRLERTMNLLEGGKGGEGRMGERGWGGDGGRVKIHIILFLDMLRCGALNW